MVTAPCINFFFDILTIFNHNKEFSKFSCDLLIIQEVFFFRFFSKSKRCNNEEGFYPGHILTIAAVTIKGVWSLL